MKSLPSRRFSRFGVSRSAGRSGYTAAAQSEGGADTTVSASQSEVTASPSTILNDGSTTSTITVTLRNASGVPLSGKTITLSSTGSNNTIVQPGTTNGSGVATGTIATTTAETKTITAVSEAITITDTATVTSTTARTPAFLSIFSAATGTSTTAVQDGGLWDGNYTNNGGAEVIAAPVTGFPSAVNVLRHTPQIGTAGAAIMETDTISVPSVGDTRYYRWYFKMVWPNTGNTDADNTHPIQDGPGGIGGTSWAWVCEVQADDTWMQGFQVQAAFGENSFADQKWHCMTMLDPDVAYRFELAVTVVSSTTFTMSVRVYDESSTLILDDSDYGRTNSGNDITLADAPVLEFRAAGSGVDGLNTLTYLKCGCNGIINSVVATQHYADQTGFAVCDNQGWIGPYGSVTGE